MSNYISFRNNGAFFIAALMSSAICFSLFGVIGAMFGVITVLLSSIVYDAKADSSNIFYVIFLFSLVIVGGTIGFILKLTVYFYIYLFFISYLYYLFYKKDSYLDRVFPFVIVFSCMGTTLQSVSASIPMAYLTGIIINLLILNVLRHKSYEINAFRNGLFSKKMFSSNENIYIRAFLYSTFLFLSLVIPDYLDFYKPYWSPLTFVMLLHPKETNIVKTTCYRFLGSALAAALIIFMFDVTRSNEIHLLILVLIIFFIPTFFNLNNSILKTFAITTFVLLILEETVFMHEPTYALPLSRAYETFIGGAIAILASFVLNFFRTE